MCWLADALEKIARFHVQALGDFAEVGVANIALSALDARKVCLAHANHLCEGPLGNHVILA